jgi:hypothetical protein
MPLMYRMLTGLPLGPAPSSLLTNQDNQTAIVTRTEITILVRPSPSPSRVTQLGTDME